MVIDEGCAKNRGALEHVLSILSWDLSDSPYQTPVDTVELSRCVEWLRLMFSMWISDCFNTPLESNPNPPFQEAIETISYILGLSLLARIM